MGLPLRCRYSLVLQVVVIIICYRGKVSSERAQGCVGSQLSLRCEEMNVIQITAVVLGDSDCLGAWCCIKDDDCTRNANENHRTDVHRRCDNKQSCTVDVLKEEIKCGFGGAWSNNDFERITYDCTDGPRNDTTNSTGDAGSNEDDHSTDCNTNEEQTKTADYSDYLTSTDGTLANLYNNTKAGPAKYESSSQALTVILVIICLIILLAIVVFLVVVYRRKKGSQVKLFDPVAMTEVDNRRNESDINANQTQGISLHDNNVPLSLYNLIDEADFPTTNGDPAVYSEVELRETIWKKSQSDRVTMDKTKAAIDDHTAGPDVYTVVNNPATSSAIKTDLVRVKSLVDKGNCFADHIYTVASNDMEDIYANETSAQIVAEVVSKAATNQDDGDQTVIENDLYCH